MPLFRQYQQAFSLNPTDAFVIDRIGIGTMFVEYSTFSGGGSAGVMIAASLPQGDTDNWNPTGYDSTVDAIVVGTYESGATLQGLAGGTRDRRVALINSATAGPLTIASQSSGTNGNSFYCPDFVDLTIPAGGGVVAIYNDLDDGFAGWYLLTPFGNSGSSTLAFKYVGE